MAEDAPRGESLDWDNVKAVWDTLTEQERQAYRRAALEMSRIKPGDPTLPLTPGNACGGGTPELGSLPLFTNNTTVGSQDTYQFGIACGCSPDDPDIPDCGAAFAESGLGPDIAYRVFVDQDCLVEVIMQPVDGSPDADDLGLWVMTDCNDPINGCVGSDDTGAIGAQEDVTFRAQRGTEYFIVVDGFLGDAGPFDLRIEEERECSISGISCLSDMDCPTGETCEGCGAGLVPVQLQHFGVE